MSYKILVVDDEANITDVSKRYLEREDFDVILASDGVEALEKWQSESPDLIVLDVMMPKKDGWQVCEEIRNEDEVPIIMLTARGEEMDRIMGLTMGADDYITKPFSPRELVLRVKTIFRRMNIGYKKKAKDDLSKSNRITYGRLDIDPETRIVLINNREIDLTIKEFDVLWLLASHPNQVFSRNQLLDQIWELDYFGDTTTVTVHISRLREKIEAIPSKPRFIKTVWGIGYKFEDRDDE
ncbi:two-component system response regulator ResD [Scopulibacillus darangshiensis]|uniref:Two-component system response regulator ResD n=1 Tax=Scopulibacillus darangshiensis TaxID=442528 RepID=A0A4R2P3Q1_9BACL|nr:response regulator transcription factor [Scopulibacillus darangshiensis]TCP29409.1 two-component system response regulator ResD [Scopulibacillus darangshiensis]